jgi:hypothetical protein
MSASKFEQRAARLRRDMAERVRPLKLGPVGPPPEAVSPARRAAVLAQLAHQLLFGEPGATGPFPSCAIPERAADLHRLRALNDPRFAQLEAQLAADPGAGPRLFGTDWPAAIAHIFDMGPPPRPKKRVALEATDLGEWRRARWAAFLASPEGQRAIADGRIVQSRDEAMNEPARTEP